jgi:hypothetical protein
MMVVGVDDEAIHADPDKVVHRVRYDGAPPDLEERFWTGLCQGAESCAQTST